jgi:RNA-directed DNA polymerase
VAQTSLTCIFELNHLRKPGRQCSAKLVGLERRQVCVGPKRSDKAIEDLSRMFNPILRGWLQYYGRYYRSALYPPMRQLDRSLARWAYRKYKKLRRHLRRATHWVARLSRRDPKLFAHWQMGVRRGSLAGAV